MPLLIALHLQVVSTRTDIFSKEYIDVLKTLQAEVPAFSGAKALSIVSEELGRPVNQIFKSFDSEPFAAASLGQVHPLTPALGGGGKAGLILCVLSIRMLRDAVHSRCVARVRS